MYNIRKKFKFEMAHQLISAYSNECKDCIHGHSYILEVFFSSNDLNDSGMVIDFKQVKDEINDYIKSWDHALVMSCQMPKDYLDNLKKYNKNLKITEYNPTAENMTFDIFSYIKHKFKSCVKVRLHETNTGYAEYAENC